MFIQRQTSIARIMLIPSNLQYFKHLRKNFMYLASSISVLGLKTSEAETDFNESTKKLFFFLNDIAF